MRRDNVIRMGSWLRGGDLNPGPLGYEGNSNCNQPQLTTIKPNKIAASSASV